MASNGVFRSVMSEKLLKDNSESAITKGFDNANEEAKKLDPKDGKKAK